MNYVLRSAVSTALVILGIASSTCHAQVIVWNESINGDLSTIQAAPSTVLLPPGLSAIIGQTIGGDHDWVTVTVPAGFQFSNLTPASYAGADPTSFVGFQGGSVFVGTNFLSDPSLYLGYSHFGPAGGLGDNIGQDILDDMGVAPGAQGFIPPLPSGDYAFLIRQANPGSLTSYQFNFNVTPVPEPGSMCLGGLFATAAFARMVRKRVPAKATK